MYPSLSPSAIRDMKAALTRSEVDIMSGTRRICEGLKVMVGAVHDKESCRRAF